MTAKLTSPSVVRQLLRDLDIAPRKALGQNFLIDANILDCILTEADLRRDDRVLEIGPGLGTLTERLAAAAGAVTAVEKDARLAAFLRQRFHDDPRVAILESDFLDLECGALLREYGITKLVANLPYSSGSRMLVELAQADEPPELVVVTVQLEVGERLGAGPGSRDYGLLSVWMQLCYDVAVCRRISPTCFCPRPEVWSAIVRLRRRAALPKANRLFFYELTRYAFTHRRKQLVSIFDHVPGDLHVPAYRMVELLGRMGQDARARPENLSVAEWWALAGGLGGKGE